MVRTEFSADKILEGVRKIFAKKGFDASSMQNLAKGVGMSVGNFYRYFPSKTAIVEALARQDLDAIEAEFEKISQADDSQAAFQDALRKSILNTTQVDAVIWMEIEAAATRTPEIAVKLDVLEETIESQLVQAFSTAFSIPIDDANDVFGDQAKLIMTMVHGISKRRVLGPIPPSLVQACIDNIDLLFETSAKSYFETKLAKGF